MIVHTERQACDPAARLQRAWPRTTFLAASTFLLSLSLPGPLFADVRLPAMFSDHMVLQQDAVVPVWGWADPGEEISVSIAGRRRSTRAGADGRWEVRLDRLEAGKRLTLTVRGGNTIEVKDVLVGEVWLGSGQSNMAMPVSRVVGFENERVGARLPDVRMFKVLSGGSRTAQQDCEGSWVVCSPETVGGFAGTLFFFGRALHAELGVPVGLINSSVGGTPIQLWISPETQRAAPELRPYFEANPEKPVSPTASAAAGSRARGGLGGLFNGKIAPLIPYAIRGAVWYQGEANTRQDAVFYEAQLKVLVNDWRARWGSPFPFAWVQLPNFSWSESGRGEPREQVIRAEGWCWVREGMLNALAERNTGMAITVDIGSPTNIHPKNKQEVGRRLSLWALGTVYGKNVPATSGPLPAGHEVKEEQVIVTFAHTEGGLVTREGGAPREFTLAGADRMWHPAQARIDGEHVVVSSPHVRQPVALRYAWRDNPDCNLFNGAGLPASPFRTDTWQSGILTGNAMEPGKESGRN